MEGWLGWCVLRIDGGKERTERGIKSWYTFQRHETVCRLLAYLFGITLTGGF